VQSTFGLVFAPENLSDLSREDVKEFLSHEVDQMEKKCSSCSADSRRIWVNS
jgi:hypothetical protein